MLTLHRRHKKTCPHTDRYIKLDAHRCPMWVEGMLDGVYRRESLKVSSWEKAEQIRREMEEGKGVKHVPISEAIETFLAEQQARALTESTLRKLRTLAAALSDFCKSKNIANISQLNIDRVRQFRVSWKDSPISALKKLERTRSFFKFCVDSGWLKDNPAKPLKSPIVTDPPTLPFTDAEVEKIIKHATGKWRTLALLLVNSGLRIGDAMKLTPAEVVDGRLFLYMQKTRVPVCVPLPDFLLHELRQLPLEGGYYFWKREASSKLETASGNARRAFRQICKEAEVVHGHPHRFRDTFAVRLLQAGVPLQDVSILLGHTSIKVTEKHYAPWVKERQTRLEELVARTWKTQLVRVK
ncbi:MAG TPA: tyrosine-type recombinase/integrase [Bryobacteraceae bacterium]